MLGGLLHDIGAFSLDDRLALNGGEPPSAQNHAVAGALLLEDFAPLSGARRLYPSPSRALEQRRRQHAFRTRRLAAQPYPASGGPGRCACRPPA